MDRPNFLVLGAPKCGTSSLCHYLGQHSDVFIAPVKEPVFFDAEYERGIEYYWRTYFRGYAGESWVGEGRVFHLLLPFVATRVHESLPDARLIAILRNPTDRAYSHWWHRYARRDEELAFEDAVDANLRALEGGERFVGEEGARAWREGLVHAGAMASSFRVYLDCGHYAEQIQRYWKLFGRERLLVLFYDDLVRDAEAVVRQATDFLGAPPMTLGDPEAQNLAATRRPGAIHARLRRALHGRDPFGALPHALADPLRRALGERTVERPRLPDPVRQRLNAYFAERNQTLAELVSRDLSAWNA